MPQDALKKEWTDHVLTLAADRFERRLAEEMSATRVEIAQCRSDLRTELHEGLGGLRIDLAHLRVDMANLRSELLRWSFMFWLGQIAVVAGMLAYVLRALER